jgi:hypothetical protein
MSANRWVVEVDPPAEVVATYANDAGVEVSQAAQPVLMVEVYATGQKGQTGDVTPAAQQLLADAQTAAGVAAASAQHAQDMAGTATYQAGIATTEAQVAIDQAASITTAANTASTQAAIATDAASTATAAAATATTKAAQATASATAASDSESVASTAASTANTKATAAAASATAAATSASNAATSASGAATSATNAATSETNAANSASAASTSAGTANTKATAAAASATAASTSETNAAASATAAGTSASAAAASATAASTSASNAATSETNASTSASNAATSETNAAASASSASTSAGTATTKATAASTSASNAATSETNASSSASAAATSATNAANSATAAAASAATAADAQVNADWNSTTGKSQILNKPTLFSGNYADLSGKPTLFDGTWTSLTGKPTIPTANSQLTNDSNYITQSGARTAISVSGDLSYNSSTGVISYSAASALTVKDEGTTLTSAAASINFVGSPVRATHTGADVTVTVFGTYACTCSVTSAPGVVSGQLLKLNMTGASRQIGGSIASFEVTDWTNTVHNYTATSSAALSNDITATGSVGDVLTLSIVAIDDLGNRSAPVVKNINVVTNSAPTGTITANVPTSIDTASTNNQMSFTGLVDNDGTAFTYSITSISDSGFVVSKTTNIADGEIITATAPTLTTTEYSVTFQVKGVDSLGAETSPVTVSIPVIFSRAVGVVLKATGSSGPTWGQIDADGNDIVNKDSTYFASHAAYALTDVTVDGQALVKLPKFYYKVGLISGGTNNGLMGYWVSDKARPGFSVHPAFMNSGSEIAQCYVGKYPGSMDGSTKLASVVGGTVTSNQTFSTFQTYATNRNVSGVTGFQMMHIWHVAAVQLLYLVENRTMETTSPYTYRGITNFSGGTAIREWIDGIKLDSGGTNVNTFDTSGNKTYVASGAARPTGSYPVTFRSTGTGAICFLAATFTATQTSATVKDVQNSLAAAGDICIWGWDTSDTTTSGFYSYAFTTDGATPSTAIGARLAKV